MHHDFDSVCKAVGRLYLQTTLERDALLGQAQAALVEARARIGELEEATAILQREKDELIRVLATRGPLEESTR